uniref:Uncharacterized protein n=1 Tax=Arundo donax TaxID=35708 RepID=A0A0A8YZN5_ARUDO
MKLLMASSSSFYLFAYPFVCHDGCGIWLSGMVYIYHLGRESRFMSM